MDAEITPVTYVPPEIKPPPAPPSANTATVSDDVQWTRAQSTLQQDAVHESASVLLGELQARRQAELGVEHFEQLLRKAAEAIRREVQQEAFEIQQSLRIEALQAQQVSQMLQNRTNPVDPEQLRFQTDTLARIM